MQDPAEDGETRIMNKKICSIGIVGALIFLLAGRLSVLAAETVASYGYEVEEDQLILYVSDPGEVKQVKSQVGTVESQSVSFSSQKESRFPIETVILLDNSLSIREKYREGILQIIQELAAGRTEGEKFTIAVFGENIQFLVRGSSDYTEIRRALDSITWENRETYLTDMLFELIQEMAQEENAPFRRFVLISDGMDGASIGYTKEELNNIIEENPAPIYTIGCVYKENEEALENMFSLSRKTGGVSWLMDDLSDPMEVIEQVHETDAVLRVTVKLPIEMCDGSLKGVKLTLINGIGEYETSVMATMPFAQVKETEIEEIPKGETDPAPVTVPLETEQFSTSNEGSFESFSQSMVFPVLVGVLLILTAIAFVYAMKKRKGNAREDKKDNSEKEENPEENEGTEFIDRGEDLENDGSTFMLWKEKNYFKLYLTDINDPGRRFEIPLRDKVVIGRNAVESQVVLDYDKSVSGRHCEIFVKNNRFYVHDLMASNTTGVNGKQMEPGGEMEIYSGCILTLGRLKIKVEFR